VRKVRLQLRVMGGCIESEQISDFFAKIFFGLRFPVGPKRNTSINSKGKYVQDLVQLVVTFCLALSFNARVFVL